METDEEVINDVRGYKPAAASEVSHNEAAPVSEVSHSEAAPVSEVSHNEATAASGVSHNNAAPASEGPHSEAVDHPKDFRGASADLDDELLDLVDEIKKFDDRKFVKDLEEEEPVDEELETILKEVFSPKLDEQISNAEQHVDKVYESALELDKNIQEMEEHYRQEKEKWQNLRTVIHNLSNDRTFPQELKQNLQSTGTLVEKVQDYIENRELIKIPEKLEATLQLIHLFKQLSKHNAIPQQAKQTLETLSNDLLIESRRYSTFALLYLHNNVNVSHKRLWSYATDDLFKILKEIAEYPLLSAEAKISINTSIEKLSTFSNYAREEEKRDVYNGLIQIIGKFSRDKLLPKELRADINASVELSKRIVSVVETWNNFVKEKGENIFHKETSSPVKASLKDLLNYKGLPEKCADYINDALSELKVKSSIASTLKVLLKDAEAKKDSNTQQLLVSFDNENEREELRKMYGGPDVDLNEFLSDADLKADDDDDDSEVRIPDDEISQQAKQAYTEFVSEFREALNRNEAEDPDILLDESKTEHVFKESPEVKPEKPANWDQLLRKYFHVGENELEKERLTLWQNHHDINFDELDKEEELKQLERDRIQWLTLVRNNLRDTFLLKESARLKAEWSQRGYPGVVGSEERELNDSLREFEEKLKFEEARLRREEREKAGQRNLFKLEYENEEDDNAVADGKVGDIERR